jgi:hypothetical protein
MIFEQRKNFWPSYCFQSFVYQITITWLYSMKSFQLIYFSNRVPFVMSFSFLVFQVLIFKFNLWTFPFSSPLNLIYFVFGFCIILNNLFFLTLLLSFKLLRTRAHNTQHPVSLLKTCLNAHNLTFRSIVGLFFSTVLF